MNKTLGSLFAVAVMLLIPGACIVSGLRSIEHAHQIQRDGVTTTAVVDDNVTTRSGDYCQDADVSYTTDDGTPERGTVDVDGCLTVGSHVAVIYDPQAPNVVVLKERSGGPTSGAGGTLAVGIAILIFYAGVTFWTLAKRRAGASVAGHVVEHLTGPRSPIGIVASAATTLGALVIGSHLFSEHGGSQDLGLVLLIAAILPAGYLAVPRLRPARAFPNRRVNHYLRGIAWVCIVAICSLSFTVVRDVWLRTSGRPIGGTVTQVEAVHSRGSTDYNYTVVLANGEVLPLGEISSSEVGRQHTGDRVVLELDPRGFFSPAAVTSRSADIDEIALAALLVLVALNAGVAVRRRRQPGTPAGLPAAAGVQASLPVTAG